MGEAPSTPTKSVAGGGGGEEPSPPPEGLEPLHDSTSPSFFTSAWSAMVSSELAYEAALEKRLGEHEACRLLAATDAMASPLREDGTVLLGWINDKITGLDHASTAESLNKLDAAQVSAALKALEAELEGDELREKENQKGDIQAGLREVATRIAEEAQIHRTLTILVNFIENDL